MCGRVLRVTGRDAVFAMTNFFSGIEDSSALSFEIKWGTCGRRLPYEVVRRGSAILALMMNVSF